MLNHVVNSLPICLLSSQIPVGLHSPTIFVPFFSCGMLFHNALTRFTVKFSIFNNDYLAISRMIFKVSCISVAYNAAFMSVNGLITLSKSCWRIQTQR